MCRARWQSAQRTSHLASSSSTAASLTPLRATFESEKLLQPRTWSNSMQYEGNWFPQSTHGLSFAAPMIPLICATCRFFHARVFARRRSAYVGSASRRLRWYSVLAARCAAVGMDSNYTEIHARNLTKPASQRALLEILTTPKSRGTQYVLQLTPRGRPRPPWGHPPWRRLARVRTRRRLPRWRWSSRTCREDRERRPG